MSRFSVPEMSCGHCKAAIEDAVLDVDGAAELTFDMDARVVEIDTVLDAEEILSSMKAAGYEASVLG